MQSQRGLAVDSQRTQESLSLPYNKTAQLEHSSTLFLLCVVHVYVNHVFSGEAINATPKLRALVLCPSPEERHDHRLEYALPSELGEGD